MGFASFLIGQDSLVWLSVKPKRLLYRLLQVWIMMLQIRRSVPNRVRSVPFCGKGVARGVNEQYPVPHWYGTEYATARKCAVPFSVPYSRDDVRYAKSTVQDVPGSRACKPSTFAKSIVTWQTLCLTSVSFSCLTIKCQAAKWLCQAKIYWNRLAGKCFASHLQHEPRITSLEVGWVMRTSHMHAPK